MAIITLKCLTLSRRLSLCTFSWLQKGSDTAAEVQSRPRSRLVKRGFFQVFFPGCLALLRAEQGKQSLCTRISALASLALKDAYLKWQSDLNTKITENLFTPTLPDPGRAELFPSLSHLLRAQHTQLQALLYKHLRESLHLLVVIFAFS